MGKSSHVPYEIDYKELINVKDEEEMDVLCSKLEKNSREVKEIVYDENKDRSNFIWKRIGKEDEEQVRNLVDTVFKNLERKDFLIPWTEEQRNRFFDEAYSFLFGAYDGDKLVAMSQIFTPKEIEEEYYDILNIPKSESICELGGFLVYPEYRNQKIMTRLSQITMDYFENLDYDYIISTVHPENEASNKIVQKLGFQLFTTLTTQSGFLRALYWKKNSK